MRAIKMNKEVELILTKLKIVSEEKENGAYICDREHSKILLEYIDALKAEIQEAKIKQLENNRDKAIEYINKNIAIYHKQLPLIAIDYEEIINILKGDSDE